MPSSYSASLRFELQFTGENVNTWGVRLNTLFTRADFAIAGRANIVTTGGTYTLSSSNSADDEARASTLNITGTGGTIIVPSVPKIYKIENDASALVIISTGSGATVTVDANSIVEVHCTGSIVRTLGYGGKSIQQWVEGIVFGTLSGLPAVSGNNGKFNYTDGASAFWKFITIADVTDYAADQAAKQVAAQDEAVAFAVAL